MGSAPRRISARSSLTRLLDRRLRAARELGIPVPAGFARRPGPPRPRDVAVLDRWIARDLDVAGGKCLPPWDEPDEERGSDGPTPFSPLS